jgi:hypothetical protein
MTRLRIALVFTILAASAAVAAAAPADNPVLTAVVGPGFSISLRDATGAVVRNLAPGTYTVNVDDRGTEHNFALLGPGVTQRTDIEFVGTATWTVTFTDGTYTYLCDAHPTTMRGTFTVGQQVTTTTTPPPPPPPPPPVPVPPKKVSAKVGPGALVIIRAKSLIAGKYWITVVDASTKDNLHLKGPGVNRMTSIRGRGTVVWKLTLKPGRYTYRSDAHPARHGFFLVKPKESAG